MPKLNHFEFRDYVRQTVPQMDRLLHKQRDGRNAENPIISSGQLAWSIFYQVTLGVSSFFLLDQKLDSALLWILLKISSSRCPGSDSTLLNAANGWEPSGIRKVAYETSLALKRKGQLTAGVGAHKSIRPAAIDGSCFGSHYFSVLTLLGDDVRMVLDLEPYPGQGHELNASFSIQQRWKQRSSVPFTHLLADGIYMSESWFRRAWELDSHLLVKTTQEDLTVVQTLKDRWASFDDSPSSSELPENWEWAEGKDNTRNRSYKILRCEELSWHGLTLNGAMVQITDHDEDTTQYFWVFTTDTELSANTLRQLAHHRWGIENNLFKELNDLVGSKKSYIQSSSTKQTILFWQMIGWGLLQSFRLSFWTVIQTLCPRKQVTKQWLSDRLKEGSWRAIPNAPPD